MPELTGGVTATPEELEVAPAVLNSALEQEAALVEDQVMLTGVLTGTEGSVGEMETEGGLAVTVTVV